MSDLRDASEIRTALAHAGWRVTQLIGDALTVEDRTYDVTNVLASRGSLRAWITVARECEAGGTADRVLSRLARPTTAVRRTGETKVFVDVDDYGRARAELEYLLPALRSENFYQGVVDAAADRGWDTADSARSASEDWDESWTIRATRAGEALLIGLLSRWPQGEEPISESGGSAVASSRGFSISVTVHTTIEAEALAHTLLTGL
jgi:hypothetical protein